MQCAHSARTNIRRLLFTKRRTPSHILHKAFVYVKTLSQKLLFLIALGSPFGYILFCRNPTACGSLVKQCCNLLTLPQRFFYILPPFILNVNTFFIFLLYSFGFQYLQNFLRYYTKFLFLPSYGSSPFHHTPKKARFKNEPL